MPTWNFNVNVIFSSWAKIEQLDSWSKHGYKFLEIVRLQMGVVGKEDLQAIL